MGADTVTPFKTGNEPLNYELLEIPSISSDEYTLPVSNWKLLLLMDTGFSDDYALLFFRDE